MRTVAAECSRREAAVAGWRGALILFAAAVLGAWYGTGAIVALAGALAVGYYLLAQRWLRAIVVVLLVVAALLGSDVPVVVALAQALAGAVLAFGALCLYAQWPAMRRGTPPADAGDDAGGAS